MIVGEAFKAADWGDWMMRDMGPGVRPLPRRSLIGGLVSSLSLAGCTGLDSLPTLPNAAPGTYTLGPGDQVRIITFGEQQLTGEFRVDAAGEIALPLVGNVHAAGLTPRELNKAVETALSKSSLYRNPSVSSEVVAYRPIFILGEVARPGQYPYQPEMTVVTAVAIAGGFTYRAVTNKFSIVRVTGSRSLEGVASRETPVQPGDVVSVYERYI